MNTSIPVPPRLSMSEYAIWVGENWKHDGDASRHMRQKDIEERIEKPFCIPADEPMQVSSGGEG